MTRRYNNNIKTIYGILNMLSQLILNCLKIFSDFDCFNINESELHAVVNSRSLITLPIHILYEAALQFDSSGNCVGWFSIVHSTVDIRAKYR